MEVAAAPINPDKVFGLRELTEVSIKAIPALYSEAFIRAQAINVKAKRKVAGAIVATSAGVCLTAAFVPVPGATPASILTTQTGLLTAIAKVYNITG
ncbi:MAG: hypothetical protein F6K47_16120 [Symploca sp. SIO2E6]|nr:hypothetical protein [Symploca sp. SIO2E6]